MCGVDSLNSPEPFFCTYSVGSWQCTVTLTPRIKLTIWEVVRRIFVWNVLFYIYMEAFYGKVFVIYSWKEVEGRNSIWRIYPLLHFTNCTLYFGGMKLLNVWKIGYFNLVVPQIIFNYGKNLKYSSITRIGIQLHGTLASWIVGV